MENPRDSSPRAHDAHDAQPDPAIDGLPALCSPWMNSSSAFGDQIDQIAAFFAQGSTLVFPAEEPSISPDYAQSQQNPASNIAASANAPSNTNTTLTSQPGPAGTRYIPQSPHSGSAWILPTTATTATVGATSQLLSEMDGFPLPHNQQAFLSALTSEFCQSDTFFTHPQLPVSAVDDDGTLPTPAGGVIDSDGFVQGYDTKFDPKQDHSWPSEDHASSSGAPGSSDEMLAQYASMPAFVLDTPNEHQTLSSFAPVFGPSPPPRPSNRVQKKARKKPTKALDIVLYEPEAAAEGSSKARSGDAGAAVTAQPRKHIVFEHTNGKVGAEMMVLGTAPRHRSKFTPEKRRETNMARKEGVCRRCQSSKRKCDLAIQQSLYVPCTRCRESKLYKGASPMPCFRSELRDVMFFRAGPAENEPFFSGRLKNIMVEVPSGPWIADISMPNAPVETIKLTQGVGNHRLTIYASEFTPLPHDKVSLTWKDRLGNHHEMKMPPYCLTNVQKLTTQIEQYINSAKRDYLGLLAREGPLVSTTVRMAVQYAHTRPGSLVSMALDIWAISRMIEIEWQMCGHEHETLGVRRISDPSNPRNGKIPIPPMIDTQMDQIIINNVLKPLKDRLLDQFEARISPFRREDWFDVYLTSFIVLNHIERLAKHSVYHARLHSMPSRFSNVPFLGGVFHTAKVVLSRFHFVCRGSVPLQLDWDSPDAADMADLDATQTAFMKQTQELVKAKNTALMHLRTQHRYEDSMYWSSQLFNENWDNSPARVIEM